jgi:hypothetical protein
VVSGDIPVVHLIGGDGPRNGYFLFEGGKVFVNNNRTMSSYSFELGGETFEVIVNSLITPAFAIGSGYTSPAGDVVGSSLYGVDGNLFRLLDESALQRLAEMYDLDISGGGPPPVGNLDKGEDLVSTPGAAIAITLLALAYGFYAFSGLGGGFRG